MGLKSGKILKIWKNYNQQEQGFGNLTVAFIITKSLTYNWSEIPSTISSHWLEWIVTFFKEWKIFLRHGKGQFNKTSREIFNESATKGWKKS